MAIIGVTIIVVVVVVIIMIEIVLRGVDSCIGGRIGFLSGGVGSIFILLLLLCNSLNGALNLRNDALLSHSDRSALPQSTGLTFSSHVHINLTVASIFTLVDDVPGYGAPEESLATLAGELTVVESRSSIATDKTQFILLRRIRHDC